MNKLPKLLDPWQYAQHGEMFSDILNISEMPRLLTEQALKAGDVPISVEIKKREDGKVILSLDIKTQVELTCQRCLGKLNFDIEHDVSFVLFKSEVARSNYFGNDEETQLDGDDGLVCEDVLDVATLVEDEILLCLPMVPRHDSCDLNQKIVAQDDKDDSVLHPFANLKKLINK